MSDPELRPARSSMVAKKRTKRWLRRMPVLDLQIGRLLYPCPTTPRPLVRGDCDDVPRPCPWVGCRYNLYLTVTSAGTLRPTFNELLEPWEVDPRHSCALDLAERGAMTQQEIGDIMGISRERVRQIEEEACMRLRSLADILRLRHA